MPEEKRMATNWDAILSNTNNLQDVLSILKKVLAQLDIKADMTTVDEALATINSLDADVQEKLGVLAQELEAFYQEKEDALNDLESAKEEILTQVNNITTVNSINDLNTIEKWDGRTVYVKNVGNYRYDSSLNNWFLVSNLAQSVISSSGFTQEQINDRTVNILDFRAKPGLLNDAGDAIQAAIDNAISRGVWSVKIPAGLWVSSRTLELAGTGNNSRDGVTLVGDNDKTTVIFLKTTQDIPLILSKSLSGSHTGHGLTGISLYAHPDNKGVGTGLKLVGTGFMNVSKFNIFDFNLGLHLYNTGEFGMFGEAGNKYCEYDRFRDGRIHKNNINILFETHLTGDSSFHGVSFDNVQCQVKSGGIGVYIKGLPTKLAVWYDAQVNLNFWTSTNINDNMKILKIENAQCSALVGSMMCEGTGYIEYSNTSFNVEGVSISFRNSEVPVFVGDDADVMGGPAIRFNNLTSRSYNLARSPSAKISQYYLQEPSFTYTKSRSYPNDRLTDSGIKRVTSSKTPQAGTYEGLFLYAKTGAEIFFGESPNDGGEYKLIPRFSLNASSSAGNSYSANYTFDLNLYDINGNTEAGTNTGYSFTRVAFKPKVNGLVTVGDPTNKFYQVWTTGWTIAQNGITPTSDSSFSIGNDSFRVKDVTTTSTKLHSSYGCVPIVTATYTLGLTSLTWKDAFLQNAVTVVSDERHKTDIQELSEVEIQCAIDCGKLYRRYKLKASVEEKGLEAARYHIGVIAQQVIECFTNHGLDWHKYGIIAFEAWDAIAGIEYQAATYDENGVELTPEIEAVASREAGEIYMMKYEEFNSFVSAGQSYLIDHLLNKS